MNAIAAFQMARAIDEERLRYVEKRRMLVEAKERPDSFTGRRSWRGVLRFPRMASAAARG
jgi:hypothetical protein